MGKTPSHVIKYEKKGKDGGKSIWMKVGVAWLHKDGNKTSFGITLDSLPTNFDGRLVAFELDEPASE